MAGKAGSDGSSMRGDSIKFGLERIDMKKYEPNIERLLERVLGKGTTRDSDTGQLVPPGLSESALWLGNQRAGQKP